jgi:hypothetical protein
MTTPDRPGGTATGWARLPRWQHGLLIAFCVVGLIAAVANVAAASSNGARGLHTAVALLDGGILASLVVAYRRRAAP